jgi:hypothetical protein
LERRISREGNLGDERLLGYIRRVNLDILWSREGGTVDGTLTQLRKMIMLCKDLGMVNIDVCIGSWPLADNVGFRLAITMLQA